MFKITTEKSRSYSHQPKELGFKILKSFARVGNYKHQILFRVNFGYTEFSLTIYWGRCLKSPKFQNLTLKSQDKITCYDSEETVLLREDQVYTIREVLWKNGGDGFLYPKVSLMEFKKDFDYDVYRFLPKKEEIYE